MTLNAGVSAAREGAPEGSNRRELYRVPQRRLVEVLRQRGERIITRSGGWVMLTRLERGGCYHVGPRGQLRIGSYERDRAFSAPWIARNLLDVA